MLCPLVCVTQPVVFIIVMEKNRSGAPPDRENNRETSADSNTPEIFSPYLPADFEHWSKLSYWHPFEAACLSVGLGPILISNASQQELDCEPDTFELISKHLRLANRAAEAEVLPAQATPREWLSWFTSRAIPVPDKLAENVASIPDLEKFGLVKLSPDQTEAILEGIDFLKVAVSEDRSTNLNASSSTKEIQSLEKLVITMALSGYGHDPYGSRSSTAKEIADDAAANGISINEDTVRKYLKRAAENHLSRSE